MKLELTSTPLFYNFNVDYDTIAHNYCFIILLKDTSIALQFVIDFERLILSSSKMIVDNNLGKYSVIPKIPSSTIMLEPIELRDTDCLLKKFIDFVNKAYPMEPYEDFHEYFTLTNIRCLFNEIIHDAKIRALI